MWTPFDFYVPGMNETVTNMNTGMPLHTRVSMPSGWRLRGLSSPGIALPASASRRSCADAPAAARERDTHPPAREAPRPRGARSEVGPERTRHEPESRSRAKGRSSSA